MKYSYPAIIHKENDTYWAEFPDLEGCYSDGENITDLMFNAQESLTAYMLSLAERKIKAVPPSVIEKLRLESDSDFVSYVCCVIPEKAKSVKKTLTIPAWLNEQAEKSGVNFSETLQNALVKKLGLVGQFDQLTVFSLVSSLMVISLILHQSDYFS